MKRAFVSSACGVGVSAPMGSWNGAYMASSCVSQMMAWVSRMSHAAAVRKSSTKKRPKEWMRMKRRRARKRHVSAAAAQMTP